MVICLKRGANVLHNYGPADATATPSSLASLKIQLGLNFLVPAYPGCPGKKTVVKINGCLVCLFTTAAAATTTTTTTTYYYHDHDHDHHYHYYCSTSFETPMSRVQMPEWVGASVSGRRLRAGLIRGQQTAPEIC